MMFPSWNRSTSESPVYLNTNKMVLFFFQWTVREWWSITKQRPLHLSTYTLPKTLKARRMLCSNRWTSTPPRRPLNLRTSTYTRPSIRSKLLWFWSWISKLLERNRWNSTSWIATTLEQNCSKEVSLPTRALDSVVADYPSSVAADTVVIRLIPESLNADVTLSNLEIVGCFEPGTMMY